MSDVAKTPREELECKKKYLYEHSMFWECNDGSKCQILEEDVCDLLNELNKEFEDYEKLLDSKDSFIHKFKRDIEELGISIKLFEDDIATKDKKIDEQQATISQLKEENKELGKNFDDIVEWASEISKRNVVLDEKIGELQRENKKLKEEEKLYAQEILRLNELLKQYQANQDLGGGY